MKYAKNRLLFSALVFFLGLSTGIDCSAGEKSQSLSPLQKLCIDWKEAVASGNSREAVALADKILHQAGRKQNQDRFARAKKMFFNHIRFPVAFLDAPFNAHDFQAWRRAWLFHQLSKKIAPASQEDDEIVKAVFTAVRNTLQKGDLPNRNQNRNLWPEVIWAEGAGYCDRQAWCASELLRQYGFQTLLIMLFDEKGVSPHTFLEAEKNSRFYLIDPFCGAMRSGISFADMRRDEKIRKDFWPGQEKIQNAVEHARYILPAGPQDYCLRNIRLAEILRTVSGEKYFLHPVDPVEELGKIIRGHKIPPQACSFWTYPFQLLADDMRNGRTYPITELKIALSLEK